MWLNQDFLVVVAAGEYGALAAQGTIPSPATCKNCLVVGASEKWNDEYRTSVHFRDPVQDVCSACTFPLYCSRSATINGQFVENSSVRDTLLSQLDPCCNDTFQLPEFNLVDQVYNQSRFLLCFGASVLLNIWEYLNLDIFNRIFQLDRCGAHCSRKT